MDIAIILLSILQILSISLGVGSSTLAIVNFFYAIADGIIDETERNMMGVVYVVLRVAMLLILVTTGALLLNGYALNGVASLTPFVVAQWIILAVLYGNAVLMTLRIMPSTFGPAIQAGSWYTFGVLGALMALDLTDFSLLTFGLAYVAGLAFAASVVNGVMAVLKARRA